MELIEVTEVEKSILVILRDERPHESVLVVKDQNGRPNSYLVTRTQKIVLADSKQRQ